MGKRSLWIYSMVAVAAAVAAGGCNDDGGSGGSGGSGSSSSSTSATGGGDLASLCRTGCQRAIDQGCITDTVDACADACQQTNEMAPQCTAQYVALLQCVVAEQTACEAVPPACQDEYTSWGGCMSGGCTPSGCSGSSDACSCDADCGGRAVTVDCATDAGGVITCTCVQDGVTLGTCENADQLPECNPPDSCCASLLGL